MQQPAQQAPLSLPREMTQWIQSLNLTYKITNPKRDLANGWIYAEILSRYYPKEVEMYQYDNSFKLEKKHNNWEHLNRFLKKKQVVLTTAEYEPVIHCAPNAGYQLLKKFYTMLTGRELNDAVEPIQQQLLRDEEDTMPEYARQTITRKMKDKELQRIPDEVTQKFTAQSIVSAHQTMRKTQRVDEGFTNTRRTGYFAAKTVKMQEQALKREKEKQEQTAMIDGVPVGDIKPVTVKTANKSIRIMRQEANIKREKKGHNSSFVLPIQDDDSDEQALESMLTDIISRTVTHKLNKQDPEFKVFKEHPERGVGYFSERFNYIPDELVVDIFISMQDHANEIVTVLSKGMMDLPDLLSFFGSAFKNVNPMVSSKGSGENEKTATDYNLLKLMVETLSLIANKLLNSDPQGTELFFLEYGLDDLVTVMAENTFKLNEMIVLLYCFVQNTNSSHLRVLQKIVDKLSRRHRNTIPHFLSRLFLYESEDLSPELYQFYLEQAQRGLHTTSPIVRTKCVTILSYLSRIRLEPILPIIPVLEKQQSDPYWELKGQILILASNALVQFNTQELENTTVQDQASPDQPGSSAQQNVISQDTAQANQAADAEIPQPENNTAEAVQVEELKREPGSQRIVSSGARRNGMDSAQIPQANESAGASPDIGSGLEPITQATVDYYTPILFKIIYAIFQQEAPKATLKIGLIYLAKIMDFYPAFTEKYLEILLSCPENIRSTTLMMDPIAGTGEEIYVSGSNTEKYRTYGAPQEWNALFVTQALQKVVEKENLQSLEWPHIEIFDACTQTEMVQSDLDDWIEIFTKMKNHFLVALCYRHFSLPAIRVLKKFFFHSELQQRAIAECLEIFIRTLGLIYQPDTDEDCKENLREFLELLHEGSETGEHKSDALREFVYKVIKEFAEENQKYYQESNLIDLMNKVVNERRGAIFEEEDPQMPSSMMGDASGRSNQKKTPNSLFGQRASPMKK